MVRLSDIDESQANHLHGDTGAIISKERERRERHSAHIKTAQQWQHAAALALRSRSRAHYQDPMNVSGREHMSGVDCFDGGNARRGIVADRKNGENNGEDMPIIHPVVDGRLKDEACANK